ncbi:hypothetical protein RBS60_02310 [Sinomonas sp. ASV486]|uniref:hypothetical protein n=1 Tax=Sinomonas sp. ASV486 TaxID=3051170 RepID=UPI0027DC83AA|nr:hypothetical protein [Sinomonas sp. ASV486]MDQ4489028.1 hypothetical protein [Sinomonas sp. ASV486]
MNEGERYTLAGPDLSCTKNRAGVAVWMTKAETDKLASDLAAEKVAADARAAAEAKAAADAEAAQQQAAQQAQQQAAQQAQEQAAQQAQQQSQQQSLAGSVTAGAFCRSSEAGAVGHTSTGLTVFCTKDAGGTRYRWRQ